MDTDIHVRFPGGKRVEALVGARVIGTDQPAASGGTDTAPAPFDLFLASLATCAGLYVLGFCQARGLATDEIGLRQHVSYDAESHLPRHVLLEVQLPADFPDRYRSAILRAVEHCKVKQTITAQPSFEITLADA